MSHINDKQVLPPNDQADPQPEQRPLDNTETVQITSDVQNRDAHGCWVERLVSHSENSDMNQNVSSSQSVSVEQTLSADKPAHKQQNSTHNMDKKSRPCAPPSHSNLRNKYPSENRGSRLNWLGNRVLETWDCWDRGMKLVLDNGEKVMLSQGEFSAWLAGQSMANEKLTDVR